MQVEASPGDRQAQGLWALRFAGAASRGLTHELSARRRVLPCDSTPLHCALSSARRRAQRDASLHYSCARFWLRIHGS